ELFTRFLEGFCESAKHAPPPLNCIEGIPATGDRRPKLPYRRWPTHTTLRRRREIHYSLRRVFFPSSPYILSLPG
ncbi:hypothetical protein BVRB_017250 isoform A, partial [Beta vulgaris subsp. vulgaris]